MAILFKISKTLFIYEEEVEFKAIRSQGPGGQHINKTASAIQLQFNLVTSSLPEKYKAIIQKFKDNRISSEGIITIKAQQYRSQKHNKEDAIARLAALLRKAIKKDKYRVPTKRTKSSEEKRLKQKKQKSQLKKSRNKPIE